MAFEQQDGLLSSDAEVLVGPKVGWNLRRVAVAIGGCAALLAGGYQMGIRTATDRGSLRGLTQEAILTKFEFRDAYNQYVQGMSTAQISQANADILNNAAAAGPQIDPLKAWYDAGAAADKTSADNYMDKALSNSIQPATPSKHAPAPVHSVSSYQEFGELYSRETAGKPWPVIVKIDEVVKEAVLPVGASSGVTQLNHWYRQHATAEEKHDFEQNAAEHVKM